MFRRVLVAAVLSMGMGVSGTAMVVQAASVPAVPAVSTVSSAAAPATPAAPTFECEPGIVSTICSLIAPIICHTPCYGSVASSGSAAAAPRASAGRTQAAASPSVSAASVARAASIVTLPPFNDLCTVMIRPINPFCLLP
jgi:hypothetical protein